MKFVELYETYRTEIIWWTIGWLCFALLDSLFKANYTLAIVDAILIVINYKLWKRD